VEISRLLQGFFGKNVCWTSADILVLVLRFLWKKPILRSWVTTPALQKFATPRIAYLGNAFWKQNYFLLQWKNALAYHNAGVVFVALCRSQSYDRELQLHDYLGSAFWKQKYYLMQWKNAIAYYDVGVVFVVTSEVVGSDSGLLWLSDLVLRGPLVQTTYLGDCKPRPIFVCHWKNKSKRIYYILTFCIYLHNPKTKLFLIKDSFYWFKNKIRVENIFCRHWLLDL
jgi:hypothetical protein